MDAMIVKMALMRVIVVIQVCFSLELYFLSFSSNGMRPNEVLKTKTVFSRFFSYFQLLCNKNKHQDFGCPDSTGILITMIMMATGVGSQ